MSTSSDEKWLFDKQHSYLLHTWPSSQVIFDETVPRLKKEQHTRNQGKTAGEEVKEEDFDRVTTYAASKDVSQIGHSCCWIISLSMVVLNRGIDKKTMASEKNAPKTTQ